jgi:nitrogen fixation/metabolism regulation signal transduction histidine kinase
MIIQFNGYLLTCRLNSTSAKYKAGTKTQIKQKQYTQNKTLKKENKNKYIEKQYKRSTGAEILYHILLLLLLLIIIIIIIIMSVALNMYTTRN